MLDARKILGKNGEDLATTFCEERGFLIIVRNWRCRLGEIDIIAERDGILHFIEVKTRKSFVYGCPEDAIDGLKLRHLERTIEAYIETCKKTYRGYQVDALAICILPNEKVEYNFIEDIL